MKPYISFVSIARNDDHGEKFLERMQIFVSGILEQLTKYDLSSELIIVEWNPPSDRPRLSEAISWTHKDGPCKIRIIEVSPDIHKRFQYFDKISLFQMIGKNVGIRRARGEFVVATNIDVLFSDELIKSLASKSLKSEFFYRIDRYDVDKIPYGGAVREQLDYCENNVIRVHRKDTAGGTVSPITKATMQLKNVFSTSYPKLHINACGDFTLMQSEKWHELRGYPEYEIYSFNIDSLILQMAYEDGLKEKILKDPLRIYHMEHSSGWTPESSDKMFQRLEDKGIPFMNIEEFGRLASKMHKNKSPMISNKEDWGLGSETLPEVCITK